LSLAGVQRKLPLTRRADGGWALPVNGVPSTHILKPQIDNPNWPGTVENEAFCLRLARLAGLRVAEVEVLQFRDQPVLVVERFDRRISNGQVTRIHQEDSCQALGLRPTQKYEDHGGPGFLKIANVLKRFRRESDLPDLLTLATFNVAIGNADSHGKNYSILHHPDGSLKLSPGYDLMSTVMYPEVSRTMGMYIDSVRRIDQVTGLRIVNEAVSWGIPRDEAEQIVANSLHGLSTAFENMDSGFRAIPGLSDVIKRRTAELAETLLTRVEGEVADSKKLT
jgi:serine/threonine-protein kinase HipA